MIGRPRLCDDGRIAFSNGLRMTLQRSYAEDWRPHDDRPPKSYGRLPFAQSTNEADFVIPILPTEHVWIGLERPDPPEIAEIILSPQPTGAMLTRTCPPNHAIKGVPESDGYRAIAAGDVLRISIGTATVDYRCELTLVARRAHEILENATLSALTPLDRRSGYSGARLP